MLIHPLERDLVPGRDRHDGAGRDDRDRRAEIEPIHTPGHTAGMLSLLVDGTDVFTGDTLFKGSVGGVRAPGHTTYADLKYLDHGQAAGAAGPRPRIHPGHTDPTTVADELEHNRSCASGAGSTPRATEPCTAMGEPATLILLGDDYDGGHKAWVRWPDGSDDIVPGSQVASAGDSDWTRWPKDKIPTSRVGRTAKIGGLAAGQAIRQAGTRAANVARDARGPAGGARAPPHRGRRADRRRAGHDEGRRDEGRAGDVVPRRRAGARGVPRGVPAQARRAARRRARRSPSRTCAR